GRSAELLERARDSIGSLDGELAEELVRDITARQKRLENLLVSAYQDLATYRFGPSLSAPLACLCLRRLRRFPRVGHSTPPAPPPAGGGGAGSRAPGSRSDRHPRG